jgi:hypothetical protein
LSNQTRQLHYNNIMDSFSKFKFPTKVKKFKITNPSLMIFVSKYENQIPWANGINNEETLKKYISTEMLPELYRSTSFPIIGSKKKSYFVEACHISLKINTDDNAVYSEEEIRKVRKLLQHQDESVAKVYLAEIVNNRKKKSFDSWKGVLKKACKDNPAFVYMLLRSVFDTSPYGSRRELADPDKNIIEWLHLQIEHKVFNPNESLSKNYFFKKSFGSGLRILNGWQYIQRDINNASKLCAAARGSGWCIADKQWASSYLSKYSFYILRKEGKPVVALRVHEGGVYECVGVHNFIPFQYFYDIKLYSDYMKLRFLECDINDYLNELSFDNFSLEWWQQRLVSWPGSYFKVEEKYRNIIESPTLECFVPYMWYISIEKLIKDFKIVLDFKILFKALSMNPQLYETINNLSESETHKEKIKSICITAWLEKIERGELTLLEHKELPLFVKESEGYNQMLEKQISTNLYKELYKTPKTFLSRNNRLNVGDLLVYNEFESYDVTLKRTTTIILNVESSDFSDHIFPDYLYNRTDFEKLRTDAWKEAITERPSFRLALPNDLSNLPEFGFDDSNVGPLQLQKAIDKIIEKPWSLDSKGKLSEKIRNKEEALKAYIKGWQKLILKNPDRLWCVSNRYFNRREYISYAALRNKQIIDTYFQSFKEAINKNRDVWHMLTDRTEKVPTIKLAFIMALYNSSNEKLKKKYFGPHSPLRENIYSDAVSELNTKILSMGAVYFFQKFKNNELGYGLEFSNFPV